MLLANILLDERQQPLRELLVEELPPFLQETAFLDRIKALIPGWEIQKLSNRSFAQGVGLKSDFFGDALLALREDLEHDQFVVRKVKLTGHNVYKRNADSVLSIASGYMKILFPDGSVSDEDFERYCVLPAVKLRQNIWEQLQVLDGEYRQYDSRIGYEVV